MSSIRHWATAMAVAGVTSMALTSSARGAPAEAPQPATPTPAARRHIGLTVAYDGDMAAHPGILAPPSIRSSARAGHTSFSHAPGWACMSTLACTSASSRAASWRIASPRDSACARRSAWGWRACTLIAELDPWVSGSHGLGSLWLNLATPFDGMSALANQARAQQEASTDGSALCKALYTDLTNGLPRITIPSLVIWGRHDYPEMGQEAYGLLGSPADQKSLHIVENAGHNCFEDAPDDFAAAVGVFVAARSK